MFYLLNFIGRNSIEVKIKKSFNPDTESVIAAKEYHKQY